MKAQQFKILEPRKYDVATEVIWSSIRLLKAIGFSEKEIPLLFNQVVERGVRAPLWLEPL